MEYHHTPTIVTVVNPPQPTYLLFGAELRDVFTENFCHAPLTSRQLSLCVMSSLLVPIIAFHLFQRVADVYKYIREVLRLSSAFY